MKFIQWIVLLLATLTLSGCAGLFSAQPSVSTSSEWECTTVDENGDWDCDEIAEEVDQALAEGNSGSEANSVAPNSYNSQVDSNPPVQVTQYRPSGGANIGNASTGSNNSSMSYSQASNRANEETGSSGSQNDVPEYRQLAYEPENTTRIEDLPDSYYAVQLIALSDKDEAIKYVRDETWLVDPSGVRILSNDKVFYAILLGIYETRGRAERAVNSIQDHLGNDKPWIRPMSSLKSAIKDANEKLGEDY